MSKHVRFLVVAAALCVLPGSGLLTSAEAALPSLGELTAAAGSSGPVVHLGADAELETVHYSPQPGVWVIEMPEATWVADAGFLAAPDLGISRAELSHVEEFGKRLSRLTVWLAGPAQLDVAAAGDGLSLQFTALDGVSPAAPAASRPLDHSALEPAASEVPVPESAASKAAPGVGTDLREVVPVSDGEALLIELHGDGAFTGSVFTLPSPDRLVVDLPGVVSRVPRTLLSVSSSLARQVRVAQNRSYPDPLTRLVVDLTGLAADTQHRLTSTPYGAVLVIAAADAALPSHAASAAAPAWTPEARVEATTAPETEDATHDPQTRVVTLPNDSGTIAIAAAPVAASEPPAPAPDVVELDPAPATVAPPPPPADERSPWVAEPSQLIEQAPAAKMVGAQAAPAAGFVTTEVDTQEQQFTGQPITLTLKDADIKDVLRTFSKLTQLNIVLDPSVSGSVTVELRDVPWDQALDLILRINDLDYILENNVLRVAKTAKLEAEKSAKANLAKAAEVAQPLKTVIKPLSYAEASQVASLLTGDGFLMSDRGSVTVDPRTNTLIIRDVVDRVEGILRLIDTLDLPTPQVVIEARIVETTRNFTHEFGIDWGFTGTMDQEHGNDTGLTFPNEIDAVGGVPLARGNNFLGFTFNDILNTFNLDFMLRAGESDGLVKIVATPRVTTQNLKSASIRSGLQIPVQTVANNTVTVQYVDATLQLQVTPQITAEGTVNLTLSVNKREPQIGLGVAGATNAPIFTREAQTNLLVRDGGTTVIGGIYTIKEDLSTNSVPGLGRIPIIKYLFTSKGVLKSHDELLIFITPRIVKY